MTGDVQDLIALVSATQRLNQVPVFGTDISCRYHIRSGTHPQELLEPGGGRRLAELTPPVVVAVASSSGGECVIKVHFPSQDDHQSPHGSVVERITSNDEVVSSILAVGIEAPNEARDHRFFFAFFWGCHGVVAFLVVWPFGTFRSKGGWAAGARGEFFRADLTPTLRSCNLPVLVLSCIKRCIVRRLCFSSLSQSNLIS